MLLSCSETYFSVEIVSNNVNGNVAIHIFHRKAFEIQFEKKMRYLFLESDLEKSHNNL